MGYRIVVEVSVEELEKRVNRLLEKGWLALGGVAVKPDGQGGVAGYLQALVKPEDASEGPRDTYNS